MENQLQNALKRNKLFNQINISSIDLSKIKGRLLTISEGEILYKEGDSSDSLYLTVSGEINVLRKKSAGKTESVVIGKDEYFGHDELFDESPRKSIAVALMDAYLIVLSKSELVNLVNQDEAIQRNLNNLFIEFEEKSDQPEESELEELVNNFENAEPAEEFIITEADKTDEVDNTGMNAEGIIYDGDNFDETILNEAEKELESDKVEVNELLNQDDELSSILADDKTVDENALVADDDVIEDMKSLEDSFKEESLSEEEKDYKEINLIEHDNFGIIESETLEDFESSESIVEKVESEYEFPDEDRPVVPNDEEILTKPDSDFVEFDKEIETDGEEINKLEASTMDEDKLFWEFGNKDNDLDQDIDPETKDDELAVLEEVKEESFEEPIEIPDEKESEPDEEILESEIEDQDEETEPLITTRQLEMINNATRLVNSNLNLDDVLKNIIDAAVSLTRADRGTLYLVDKEKDLLWSKVLLGDELKRIELKIGEGIAGWVAENGELVKLPDAYNDERFAKKIDKESGYETKSMLCFPVKNKNEETLGVLQLLNSKNGEFGTSDEMFMNLLSNHAALALEKTDLVEKLLNSERVSSLGKISNFLINEIKKPVLVSKRYAEHLKEKDVPEDIRKIMDMMLEQLNQVAETINSAANYSEGKTILRLVKKNISNILDSYLKKIENYVKSKNCEIVSDLKADVKVSIDEKEFYQCFYHIIRNACEAMPEGGKIHLSTHKSEKGVDIKFKDEGLGIPQNIIDKIFVTFMTHGKKEGAGLGLAITKKIVEIHEGSITVQSELGEWAEFTISLPSA